MRNPDHFDPALAQRLMCHVEHLAGAIGPRHVRRPDALQAAAEFVHRQLADAGYAVHRQTYNAAGLPVANLVAELTGHARRQQIIIVGAHYDTISTTPGADDNASAVAVLIEVARRMRRLSTARTVRFVAFPCEEMPHHCTDEMGSQVYARSCRQRGDQIVGMLALEMLGYYATEPASQRVPDSIPRVLHPLFPHRGNFLAAVANLRSCRLLWHFRRGFKHAVRFPLFSIALPETVAEIRRSDNSAFWDHGYPALMLTDTSFLRNPHYHLASDTPDTLDYQRMADVTRGIVGGVCHVAGR